MRGAHVRCRWDEAAADYKAVLAASPNDPSAWNNLGNTNMVRQHRGHAGQQLSFAPAGASTSHLLP